jgi:hypothetical protein
VRFESAPGLQAQAHWGETREVRFTSGEVVRRYFFALVLGCSRLRFGIYPARDHAVVAAVGARTTVRVRRYL